jgi:DNA-binding NtrC family response regulator
MASFAEKRTEVVGALPQTLIVEDDPTLQRLYEDYLDGHGLALRHARTLAEAVAMLDQPVPAAILLDLILPDGHGHQLLEVVRERKLDTAVIVVTSAGSINMAVESMRLGAYDFLVKPFSPERLRVTVGNAIERHRLKRIERRLLPETVGRFESFIGASPAMEAVYRTIRDASASKAPIFVGGESGTGKELAAEAIHSRSPRAGKAFVALNCSAIPRDLVESELFGHVKGAFTGAVNNREGIAARADGGTLFLDEIAEMEMSLQSKLLRFVQTGTFLPIGEDRPRTVDVRFVCATNRDPLTEIANGRFREDLYYRLNVVPILMPPLRERGSDITLIARHHLQLFAQEEGKSFDGFDPEAERLLLGYDWPGNVRQLLNVVRNVVVLSSGGVVSAAMLPPLLRQASRRAPPPPQSDTVQAIRPLWEVEKDAIERAIEAADGNIAQAAHLLGIDASTIYRKRKEWARSARG